MGNLSHLKLTPAKAAPAIVERPESAFKAAIMAAGLTPPERIEADGTMHRFSSNGKRGDTSGWYVLHLDGVPAGTFGCWRAGLDSTWCSKDTKTLTEAERQAMHQRMQQAKAERDAAKAQDQAAAQVIAQTRWDAANPAPASHPYLVAKGVQSHGLRVEGSLLLVPMHDAGGTLHSLQTIAPDGEKRFLSNGRKKGCFHVIGEPGPVLVIAEGFATGASIHEATGLPVAVAFDAGNLAPVAKALRAKHPATKLVLAADNDIKPDEPNTGLTKATEAAQAVGGLLALAVSSTDQGQKADFNDLHQSEGLQAVARLIDAAAVPENIQSNTNTAPSMREAFAPIDSETGEVLAWDAQQEVTPPAITPKKRPTFKLVPIGDLIEKPDPVTYLVDELIEHPSLALVFGPQSSGKSFCTLSLACSVATGTPWMGRDVEKGAVIYLAGEGHAGIKRRLLAWSLHNQISLKNAPIFLSEVAAQFMDDDGAMAVTEALEWIAEEDGIKPALIVIDTFARNLGDGDENSNADAGKFIARVDAIRAQFGATVLLVHHTGHNPEAQDRSRGASAIGAAMDCTFQVSKTGDNIKMVQRKAKESELAKPINMTLVHPVKLPDNWNDSKGRERTSAVAVLNDSPTTQTEAKPLPKAAKLALDTYYATAAQSGQEDKEADTVSVTLEDWRVRFYEKSTADSQDAKRAAFNTARKALVDRKLVTVLNDVYTMPAKDWGFQMEKLAQGQANPKD